MTDDTTGTPQASPLVQWGFVSLAVAYEGRICKECNGGIFVVLTIVHMLWQAETREPREGGRQAASKENDDRGAGAL